MNRPARIQQLVMSLVTVLVLQVSAIPARESVPGATEATPANPPGEDSRRLQVSAWLGEVINKFAAAERVNVLYPNGQASGDDINRFAGLETDFRVWPTALSKQGRFSLHTVVEAIHTARVVEVQCTANDPDCAADSQGNPIPDPENFLKIIKDSDVLEWGAGLRVDYKVDEGMTVYAKGMLGLVRSVDSGSDVIDDHFAGLGLRYTDQNSWFRGTFMEAGWGQTDFFANHRTGRTKVDACLVISRPGKNTPPKVEPSAMYFFLEGYLDSDFGPGSDDIRIYLGAGFDIRRLFDKK